MVVWYRFCKLEDDFGTAEEREVAVLSDDQLSNTTSGKPRKFPIIIEIQTICNNKNAALKIYSWFCFVNKKKSKIRN
jgi:hypothetical protein